MTAQTATFPEELTWTPTAAELEQERQYWLAMDHAAELDAWLDLQAEFYGDDDATVDEWEREVA